MNFTGIRSAPSTSSSSSSSSTHGRKYDLFLSFRGADTRYEFGDTLFTALESQGIVVFRDNEGLKKGEEINPALEVAIKESRNAVIIVSPHFTKSKACLFELTVIMECWRIGRLSVFPVFYHIDPSDVGKLTKEFENHFNKLEDDPEDRESKWEYWKSLLDKIADWSIDPKLDEDPVGSSGGALKKLSDISAWVVREDRYTSSIIKEICQAIWDKQISDLPNISENLVGIEPQAENVKRLLELEKKDEVCVVGICGMGGIGKSTLAKYIYKKLLPCFEAGYFSDPVRKENDRLVFVQKELISKIFPKGVANLSNNAFEVENVFQTKLREKKVLIVLDDLWNNFQVNKLAGDLKWFGPGSRIIITSRIHDLLHLKKYKNIYKVNELNEDDALTLFCIKAFKQRQPKEGFEKLSMEVVDLAKGHPFALEIFGSYLSNKETKARWDGYLKELGTKVEDNIADTLQKSLEELDKGILSPGQVSPLKELFLDIACFFNGHSKNYVLYLLDGVDGFGDNLAHNLSVLEEKSLLSISYDQRLWMHDFLVDLGQQVAKNSRLLQQKDIVRVLESPSIENSQVKGIVLKLSSKEGRTFRLDALSKMANLRVLQITYNHYEDLDDIYDDEMEEFDEDLDQDDEMEEFDEDLDQDDETEEFDEDLDQDDEMGDRIQWHSDFTRTKWIGDFSRFKLSVDLRIMKWRYYPLEALPRGLNFVPTKLVKLTLKESCIKRLWDGKKSFPKLRHIDLTGCRELIEIPDMSRVPNLERLKLGYCDCLYTVHSSVGGLKRLRELHLSSCRRLEQFPYVICSECLEVLNFSFCERLKKFPNILCSLQILRDLDISGTNFTEHPSLSMEFPSLVTFNAGALNMKELPSCIASSKKLWRLSFSCPTYFRFSSCFSELTFLKDLTLDYRDFLDEPQLNDYSVGVSNLGKFSSYYSTPLVASSKPLLSLHWLALRGCQTLDELEILKLISVRSLDLSGNKFRKVPDIVGELSTLASLCLNSSTSLQELSKLPLSLGRLELRDCPSLEVLDSQMTELISKEMLRASGCSFTVAYIGFEGNPYKILYLHPKSPAYKRSMSGSLAFIDYNIKSTATCGPTLEPRIMDWFIHRSSGSGKEIQIPMDWNSKYKPSMCALMIVYEVYGYDKRQSRKQKLDELENSDIGAKEDNNNICPEFVCQLQFNDASPKYTFVVCVPEAACVGSHGLWMCIKCPLESVERGSCRVSITASNKNVLLKEGGARLLHRDAKLELVEVVTIISRRGLNLWSLHLSLTDLTVKGPVKPCGPYDDEEKRKERKEQKNCPSSTPSFSNPMGLLTSSDLSMARDITLEAFYFGYDGKRCRNCHLAQSIINDWSPYFFQGRHSASVTWGPTQTSDIPEWFTSNISGASQCRFEVATNFEKLQHIDLRDSQNLLEMPDLSKISNLKKLDVKGIEIRQLPSSIVEKLNILHVDGSFSKHNSIFLHNLSLYLKFLGKLHLSSCNLTDDLLDNNLGSLSSIWSLDLSGNKFTRIDFVSTLSNLTDLKLENCEMLKALPPRWSSRLYYIFLENCPSLTTFSDPRDILTTSETLVAGDITLQGFYFGYDSEHYCATHLAGSFIKVWCPGTHFAAVAWGPTLTSNIPKWFTCIPDISGMFQRRFEAERGCSSRQAAEASLYFDVVEELDGYSQIVSCWGYALFIIYEVLELDSCQRKGEIHEVDEHGNFSSTIFPVFVCELEVQEINDQKFPVEYCRTLGKVPIVFRVPNVPSAGRNGVWAFINADCFQGAGLKWCDDLGLCSISISSPNVEVKECGGRLVLKRDLSECYEIIKSISSHDLDLETLKKALFEETSYVFGPIMPEEKKKERKEQKNCPWLTPFFDPMGILTSSDLLMARDITLEAFYFGNDSKCYRTYHLAQSIISDRSPYFLQGRHFASVTWGPTQTTDIPEWFTSLPNISGVFQCRFEAERGCSSHQDAEASLYFDGVEDSGMFQCVPEEESSLWYYDVEEDPDGYPNIVSCWGYALFIVYEVFEVNSRQRKGETHEADEHENSSSTIFPVFTCELEVHEINDRKFPTEYSKTLGKVPIVFCVPDIPSDGRNGVWVFIDADCFQEAGLKCCSNLGLCSISISSPNVEVKEGGGRLVLKHERSECYEIIKSISAHGLDSETLKDAFYDGGFTVFGNIIPGEKWKEEKRQIGDEICEEGEEEGGVEVREEGQEEDRERNVLKPVKKKGWKSALFVICGSAFLFYRFVLKKK